MSDATRIIAEMGLKPHPEGGFYRETLRAEPVIRTDHGTERSAGTAILYLLSGDDVSKLHRIDADEVWFYHHGAPLTIVTLLPGGDWTVETLSANHPQLTVKAGRWFGAALEKGDNYCLVSCAVMPGFEFSGFELADRAELLSGWPEAKLWIDRLT